MQLSYSYHPATRVYLGASAADPDQQNPGEYLHPAHSTTVEPPTVPPGCVAKFDGAGWVTVAAEPAEEPAADAPPPEALARAARDAALSACDWRVLQAYEAAAPVPAGWQAYRQALRDWPSAAGFPDLATLPQPPQA